ncbi:hypothetical protein N7539_008946 [Penicillium diatomitis]|uniref:Enoyl reductase (ER) domain-containing protein n=1 Tax=Penicillium diatomitis TaxID=2819901 RepID=A0A9X0BJF2_9EURO|nr:uncharacterized protein N7539_008946 [Penicillium diatomitis]KAJ5469328.1 hypothetical protein N7539_008946 [Penicillium diatomitis]
MQNQAAYQPSQKAPSLQVRDAPSPSSPSAGQLVIRNRAVAINPIDSLIQSRGNMMFTHLKYPFVLGYDMAGEVMQTGPGVTHVKPGDRVLAFSRGPEKDTNDPAQSAFQKYAIVNEDFVCRIPETVDFAHAATLPLAVMTAAAALYDSSQLGLKLPQLVSSSRKKSASTSKGTVLIWGGSTSVGCNAIQLAVASGYEVFTTASPKNHDLVCRLGATRVWDYKSPSVVDDIVAELKRRILVGAVSIGSGAAEKCIQIVGRCEGNRKIAMVTYPVPDKDPENFAVLRTVAIFLFSLVSYKIRGLLGGFKSNLVVISPILDNGIARTVMTEYLPEALAEGSFVCAPEPEIVGEGLEYIQEAFVRLRGGVSAKKLVVSL